MINHFLFKRMKLYLSLISIISLVTVQAIALEKPVVKGVSKVTETKGLTMQRLAIPISGTVTDDSGAPLVGVTINIKGTSIGSSTDLNGKFTLEVPNANSVLVFRYLGYNVQEVPLKGQTVMAVQLLKSSASALSEVVVVGYGTQKRATVTGAISTVNARTISTLPVAGVDQALQGRVAGLSVVNNGSPGTAPIVTIRGNSSISFASNPLYVVDGFILTNGGLTDYDPKDIESVQVLKDASTAAIYGSRATNGVILVTTKKGDRNGQVRINFDTYAGLQSPSKYLDLLNTDQYVKYATALGGTNALPPRLQPANFGLPIYAGATQTYAQTNTDWQREYFKKNSLLTGSNISLSGGNEVSRFYTSGGYFKQEGIAQALSYERFNYRINSDHNLGKVFSVGENLYLSSANQNYDATAGNRTAITNVVRMLPYIPISDPTTNGGFQGPISSFDGSDPTNPVEAALIGSNTLKNLGILGTGYVDVHFVPWLTFRSTVGINYSNGYTSNYTPIYNDGGTLSATSAVVGFQRISTNVRLFTQQLSFDKTFDKHHVAATAVFETQGSKIITQLEAGNQSTNQVKSLQGAQNISTNNFNQANFIQSLLGRVNYEYAGKYLFQASIRRDGTSIWAPGNKYEDFPAASIGWKIDQEEFLKNSTTISELKIRASYGLTGANPVALGNYPYAANVVTNGAAYPFGNIIPSAGTASYTNGTPNPDLSWEKTKQLNVGLDLGFLNNKFTVVAEFFQRKTDNLILIPPTAPSLGFLATGTPQNIAGMQNNGVELELGYHKTEGDFKYNITGLISGIRNKVLALNSPNATLPSGSDADFGGGDVFTNTVAGRSVQNFYGWIVDGIFQNAAEITSSPIQANASPGDLKFRDVSGPNGTADGIIDNFDRTYIGSYIPKISYSLNYSATYKNFDAAFFFQGVQGNKILNAERIILEGMPRLFNAGTQVLDAWTAENTNTSIPRAISGDPNRNGRLSTRWIEDGSYLRLKNVMIGYTLPSSVFGSLSNSTFKRVRVYVSSQNLLTFTKYKGLDPEIGSKNGTLTNGVDFGQYPPARSVQFGIQAGF
ncbi:SusC/RagA family TonB-linked outer membrane protein [Arcticibacter eurypsychrophilus]|uniref:SusC/RagA family TonB-linked outer membrane protein n=1 Tax=Arcticibacter eurypsychrophilus TaxID=1434752 RepID=UPI00084E022E|nr:TonB-dependent receptor [Arcticibacter eurypsychrophilus]